MINPVLAAGQVEGGVAQGIGYALYENVVWNEGRMVNGQMTNYVMPSRRYCRDSRFFRGASVRARARRGEGHWRVAARWHGAGDCERDGKCDRRGDSPNSDYAGNSDGMWEAAREHARAEKRRVRCRVNGRDAELLDYPMARLLDVLREELKLTGIKEGCGEGECGACSVLIDGELVNSCLVPAMQAEGADDSHDRGNRERRTIARGAAGIHGVRRRAVRDLHSGNDDGGGEFAGANPRPSEAEIRDALAGNLCRCTGYTKIFESVLHACRRRKCAREIVSSLVRTETPPSIGAALERIAREPGEWRPFAGGTDLMVLLEAGKLTHRKFEYLGLRELRGIATAAEMSIGALTTYSDVRRNADDAARVFVAMPTLPRKLAALPRKIAGRWAEISRMLLPRRIRLRHCSFTTLSSN